MPIKYLVRQKFKRCFSGFVLVAFLFCFFEAFEEFQHLWRILVVIRIRLLDFLHDGAASRLVRYENALCIAYLFRFNVFISEAVFTDSICMQTTLVGKGRAPDIGLTFIVRKIC